MFLRRKIVEKPKSVNINLSNVLTIIKIQRLIRRFLLRKSLQREKKRISLSDENKDFWEQMSIEKMNSHKNDLFSKVKMISNSKREENFERVIF